MVQRLLRLYQIIRRQRQFTEPDKMRHIVGSERNRTLRPRDGSGKVAGARQEIAQRNAGGEQCRIERQRLFQQRARFVITLQCYQSFGCQRQRFWQIGGEGMRLIRGSQRSPGAPGSQERPASLTMRWHEP